ncbi:unnamed protein product [Caenorhabditis angaria]|uniref:Uncharacterized protein n=1 Tax=Caenorhabditis angaria TaxID=860376 RepID=A0A9P1IWA0_9PELO|nr:unnamed protein product [Caenorhabditis angaria]
MATLVNEIHCNARYMEAWMRATIAIDQNGTISVKISAELTLIYENYTILGHRSLIPMNMLYATHTENRNLQIILRETQKPTITIRFDNEEDRRQITRNTLFELGI